MSFALRENQRRVEMMDGLSCPFCALDAARVIFSNEYGNVIRDGFPVSDGHTLIVPKRHIGSFFELETAERDALLALLDEAKRELDESKRPDGYNIGVNDGAPAGQTILHLHIHLIPRYIGDRADPRGGIRWIMPEKADYWSKR
jgi:diadenosine tetraphosphate (Ap4A) HIT family hydrolase